MKLFSCLFCCLLALAAGAQDSTYKEFLGKYKFPAGTVIDEAIVSIENGALNMNSSAGTSVLERVKGDTFNVVSFNGICIFKRDDAKKVNGVHVDASGYVLDGVKEAAAVAVAAADLSALTEAQMAVIKEAFRQNYFERRTVLGSILP